MDIVVVVHGAIRDYLMAAEEPLRMELDEGTTVGYVVERLGIPLQGAWNASIQGKLVSDSEVLRDGDRLAIFDVIGGG